MIKVLLVDDEKLAMDYLRTLIDWEENGYEIIGCALNARKALEIYRKEKPEIVISDIQMVNMDGLELAKQIKEIDPGTVVILVSAYREFDYALKGIRYGVSNYLLKHELCAETLICELIKIRNELRAEEEKKKIYHNYFMKQLIYDRINEEEISKLNLGNRFSVMMIHKNSVYLNGVFQEQAWEKEESAAITKVLNETIKDSVRYVVDVQITPNNMMILYKVEEIVSKYEVIRLIEQRAEEIRNCLKCIADCEFNIIYSFEIKASEISAVFQQMSKHIRYAVFWKRRKEYALEQLPEASNEEKKFWNDQILELRNGIYDGEEVPEAFVCYLIESTVYPLYNLRAAKELLQLLESMLNELVEREGLIPSILLPRICKLEEIKRYYIDYIEDLYEQIQGRKAKAYSKIVLQVRQYIKKNYDKDLSLDLLGDEFQMNGVYLGQIFREEVGITFLKYLTNCRIEEAKRLLREGDKNVYEVAELVGYKTSQYFSKLFIKNVGMKPQEYRKWGEER